MQFRSPVRRASLLAAGALAAASLAVTAPAANAAPVFVDADTHLDPFASAGTFDNAPGTDCAVTTVGGAEPDVPIAENGPAASTSTSLSASFVDNNNVADTGTAVGSASATGKVTSAGGNVRTMDFTAQTTFTQTNALPTSGCYRYAGVGVDLEFKFTVAQAGFLSLTTKNTGTAYGEVYLYQSNPSGDQPYVDNYGQGLKFNTNTKVYLPAGTYSGYFEGWAGRSNPGSSPGSHSGTTTVHGEFNVAGSQTEAVSGKGKKYVTLPSARSCATHALTPSITDKKKRAKKIKQVTFFVNDVKVKKVNTPKKGATVTLPVADDQTADLVAEVKLFPKKKGKPGKVVEVSASYEACS